jgi:hypothetical protein
MPIVANPAIYKVEKQISWDKIEGKIQLEERLHYQKYGWR